MVTKGEREMEEKVRMGDYHIHTTISKIDNQKDLLQSTGNYTKYFVITYNRKEYIYIYIYIHTHTHTYIHTHPHTYIYIYIHIAE